MKKASVETLIRYGLAGCWIAAGLLQIKPAFFSSAFITRVIAPASKGQPSAIVGLMHFAGHIFLVNPAVANGIIVVIQLLLGLLLLPKKTARLALGASVVWGISVWLFGEGLAGLTSGSANLLFGYPGPALLYSLIALALLQSNAVRSAAILVTGWLVVWVGGGIYQLLPSQSHIGMISQGLVNGTSQAPALIQPLSVLFKAPIHKSMPMASMSAAHTGYLIVVVIGIIELSIGLGLVFRRTRKLSIIAAGATSVFLWIFGEGLGAVSTSSSTDLNSGPLLILLSIFVYKSAAIDGLMLKAKSVVDEYFREHFEQELTDKT